MHTRPTGTAQVNNRQILHPPSGRTPGPGQDVSFGAWAFGDGANKPATPGSVGPTSVPVAAGAADGADAAPGGALPAGGANEQLGL